MLVLACNNTAGERCRVDSCSPNATCDDNTGLVLCSCNPGYEGDGATCTDVDACVVSPCIEGVACTDLPPPADNMGYTCGDCPDGYHSDGTRCVDIDACAADPCIEGVACTDLPPPADNTGYSCGECLAPPQLSEQETAELCTQRLAACGPVFEPGVGLVDCGGCTAGEFCVSNACEPKCSTALIGGTEDALELHIMNQFADADVSASSHDVIVGDTHFYSAERWRFDQWVPNTQLAEKSLSVDLGSPPSGGFTLSFRMWPNKLTGQDTIATLGDVSLRQDANRIAAVTSSGSVTHVGSQLRKFNCNHVAIAMAENTRTLYLNGQAMSADDLGPLAVSSLLSVGPYPGRVRDVRLYSRALNEAELDEVADLCVDERVGANLVEGMPNYQCGVYACQFWPDDIHDSIDSMPANLDYYIDRQNEVFERNLLMTRMYPPGELCPYLEGVDTKRLLGFGIRRAFVNSYTHNVPAGQHWLHENFHAYQGTLSDYMGRGWSRWLNESTANYAPDYSARAGDTTLGYFTLAPHVRLDLSITNDLPDDIVYFYNGAYMYGAALWHHYVVDHHVLNPAWVGAAYTSYSQPNLRPQFELLESLGLDPQEVFLDFSARLTTWDVRYGDVYAAREARVREIRGEPGYKFAATYDATGTSGAWVEVPDELRMMNWAFSAVQIGPTAAGSYELAVSPAVGNPGHGIFRARAVIHDPTTDIRRYVDVPVDETPASVETAGGEMLFLVVTVTTSNEGLDDRDDLDLFDYRYKVTATSGTGHQAQPPGLLYCEFEAPPAPEPDPEPVPPVIDTTVPTESTEHVAVSFPASCATADGVGPTTLQVGAADTCGGTLTGATYSFVASEDYGDESCRVHLTCSDGVVTSQHHHDIWINEHNQRPVLGGFADPPAGSSGTVALSATDPDDHFLHWSLTSPSTCATATIDESGVLRFYCTAVADCSVSFQATDGEFAVSDSVNISCDAVHEPAARAVQIHGGVAVVGQRVSCFYELAPLATSDNSTVEWLVNGGVVATGVTLTGSFGYGDDLACRVTPSDGVTTGTPVTSATVSAKRLRMVGETAAGTTNAGIRNLFVYQDRVYFSAHGGGGPTYPWVTDGGQPAQFTDRARGFDSPTIFLDRLFFSAGGEMWSTDGTEVSVGARTNPAAQSGSSHFTVVDDKLLFAASADIGTQELWFTSDGVTPELYTDIHFGDVLHISQILGEYGGRFIIDAADSWHDWDPAFFTPGVDGSLIFSDLKENGPSDPRYIHLVPGGFMFAARPAGRTTLWKTDGTVRGTREIWLGQVAGGIGQVDGVWLFFNHFDGTLWATDGTERGTRQRFQIPSRPIIRHASSAAGRMWMSANGPNGQGEELWSSDGTKGGTAIIADIWPGPDHSKPANFVSTDDGRLFFTATTATEGTEIWVLE